jgi:predicted GIY-YIG superfamily endonuclease
MHPNLCSRSTAIALAAAIAAFAAASLAGLGEANRFEPPVAPEATADGLSQNQTNTDQTRMDQASTDQASTDQASTDQANAEQAVLDQANSDQTDPMQEADAFGYTGGLFEARFYEPHATTDDPHDEIRQAAALYGVDSAMMLSIAKVESDFNPRAKTGSYKGVFQLSDYEFARYGDGNIFDARDNARAAAHMFLVQAEKFRWALGHFPDYAERYIVHQQGIQGAIEHYSHPERIAWQSMCATDEGMVKGEQWCKRTIWGNLLPLWKQAFGSVDKISSADFVTMWTERINYFANKTAAAAAAAAAN